MSTSQKKKKTYKTYKETRKYGPYIKQGNFTEAIPEETQTLELLVMDIKSSVLNA